MKLFFNKKAFEVHEPVLSVLKLVIPILNTLAKSEDDAERYRCVSSLLALLVNSKIKVNHLSAEELNAFLTAIPAICSLEKSKNGSSGGKSFLESLSYLYAHLSSSFGWTYETIDKTMTISKVNEYKQYLEDNPPLHLLGAAFMGYERKQQVAVEDIMRNVMNELDSLE